MLRNAIVCLWFTLKSSDCAYCSDTFRCGIKTQRKQCNKLAGFCFRLRVLILAFQFDTLRILTEIFNCFFFLLYSIRFLFIWGWMDFLFFFKYNLFVSERYEIDKKEQDISFPITSCKKLVKFRLFQALNTQFSEFLEFYIIFRPPFG